MRAFRATLASAVALAALQSVVPAFSHTNAIGYVPGSTPGSVTFWYGNWHSETTHNEGSMMLEG